MATSKTLAVLAIVLALTGCAHPVQIAPDLARIERPADAKPKLHANVAYYVNEDLRKVESTTPGGGSDKVSTYPYRDIEVGFYKMLSNVFDNVVVTKQRPGTVPSHPGFDYVVSPVVTAGSTSSSMMTWLPTQFSIELACDIAGADGTVLYRKHVIGQGNAEASALHAEPGLPGKLAMEDALLKMQQVLLELPPPAADRSATR